MSFGGGFGGFGSNNNTQSSGFGGFGANNNNNSNNNTGGKSIFSFILATLLRATSDDAPRFDVRRVSTDRV
jgi:hypothetical protein